MKKTALFLFFTAIIAFNQQAKAQFRKQRPAETAYLNSLYKSIYDAAPHTYKNWIAAKEDGYDAIKNWCPVVSEIDNCTGDIPANVGVTTPYSIVWDVSFKLPEAEATELQMNAFQTVKNYQDAKQVATGLKNGNKIMLKILISVNMTSGGTGLPLSYCGKASLQNIAIPVKTTLALKGLRTADCPQMSSGSPDMNASYYDRALVFLGKPVDTKSSITNDDGSTTNFYTITSDKTKYNKFIVQSIVVTFEGDSADIDEAIKLVNWQKLYDLIEK